jgi:hypothetical protein
MAIDAVLLGVTLALLLARRTGRRWWNSLRPASDTGAVSAARRWTVIAKPIYPPAS